jgi:hypothetical protein
MQYQAQVADVRQEVKIVDERVNHFLRNSNDKFI